MPGSFVPQVIMIDADDTLWENNIYFERAIASFISFLNHREYSPQQVRDVLFDVELGCIAEHGYGLHSFSHALARTFERVSVEPITPALHETILGFANVIAEHPLEILPDLPETLDYLASRHRLMLVTKGAHVEQSGKIDRSGLKQYFSAVKVVAEKDLATYARLIKEHALNPEITWMAGNSPKSDVNPALAAGLNAIFLPHGDTWILEHEEVSEAPPTRKLLVAERFADLRKHF